MKVVSDPIEQIRNAGKELWRGIKADHWFANFARTGNKVHFLGQESLRGVQNLNPTETRRRFLLMFG
jgi:hypothetical protein